MGKKGGGLLDRYGPVVSARPPCFAVPSEHSKAKGGGFRGTFFLDKIVDCCYFASHRTP